MRQQPGHPQHGEHGLQPLEGRHFRQACQRVDGEVLGGGVGAQAPSQQQRQGGHENCCSQGPQGESQAPPAPDVGQQHGHLCEKGRAGEEHRRAPQRRGVPQRLKVRPLEAPCRRAEQQRRPGQDQHAQAGPCPGDGLQAPPGAVGGHRHHRCQNQDQGEFRVEALLQQLQKRPQGQGVGRHKVQNVEQAHHRSQRTQGLARLLPKGHPRLPVEQPHRHRQPSPQNHGQAVGEERVQGGFPGDGAGV